MDSFYGKTIEHPTKKNIFVKTGYVLSSWIVITTFELDASLRPRICLPRRICMSIGKPIDPLMAVRHEPLRTAGCILEIGGDLYVISTKAQAVASSQTGAVEGEVWDFQGSLAPKYSIKECVRLGELVCTVGYTTVLIKVADTFKACQVRGCKECLAPVNTNGLERRGGPDKIGETVKILPVGGSANQELDEKTGHFVELTYRPRNQGEENSMSIALHRGKVVTLPGTKPPQLTQIDTGSLVAQDGRYVGVVDWVWKVDGDTFVEVVVFDRKLLGSLWVPMHTAINVDAREASGRIPFTITRAYRHLEYCG